MRVIVNGAAGAMGKHVIDALAAKGHAVAAAVDPAFEKNAAAAEYPCLPSLSDFKGTADCLIDFSHHSATVPLLDWAVKNGVPVLLATTGQTEDELVAVKAASEKIPVFFSANMSLGVAVLCSLVRRAAEAFPDADIEIVETHHNRKLDAPSGTALALAGAIKSVREDANLVLGRSGRQKREKRDVGISSVRLGNVVGIHEVMISTGSETLTLKHEAHSRAVFADGAVLAAEFLSGKPAGLYTMEDLKEKK